MQKRWYILILVLCGWWLPMRAQLNTDRITAIGCNALYFEDYVLSIQYFNQVIKLKPYLAEPYLYRAIAKINLEDYQGALRDCQSAIACNPFMPGAYYTRGFVYRRLDEAALAEQDFSQALVFAPENKTYLLLRADARAAQEHFDEAMADMEQLLKREPESASLFFEKGAICMQMKDTACALAAFERTTELDSQNPANWSALGTVNLMREDYDKALLQLTQAVNLGSKWAGDYINRGVIFYHNHNYRGALADYDKAIELAPRDAQCYYNRGVLRHELGDYNRALDDYDRALELAPEKTEMRYQRGLVQMELRQWEDARADFDSLIARYPDFLPSYYLAAQAATALNLTKDAYRYRQTAYEREQEAQSRHSTLNTQQSAPNTSVQIAQAQPQKRDRRKEFSAQTAQTNQEPTEDEQKYQSSTRGAVQKKYADVVNEPNISLSYYTQEQPLRQTNYYHAAVSELNRRQWLPAPLHFVVQEQPLTADLVNLHFQQISQLSDQLDKQLSPALFFARAMEFALVQDYSSAIDDCTQALQLTTDREQVTVITFCRANWRYKLLQYRRATGEQTEKMSMDFDIMLRDYDQVVRLCPDFAFAYYNKANILCMQREWQAAISHYTQAIAVDADFAEAYFNRGLTYIYTDLPEQGLTDLSKAGELGIYQAYNLITRFQ